jgi:hypothetical protein
MYINFNENKHISNTKMSLIFFSTEKVDVQLEGNQEDESLDGWMNVELIREGQAAGKEGRGKRKP